MSMYADDRRQGNTSSNASNSKSSVLGNTVPRKVPEWQVVQVPLLSIQPGDSPRLKGEDKAHIARLVETEADLPPILVDRRTMKVVDGMHRLMAAALRGFETIDVIFFDGNKVDLFLRAVEENVMHGLPLSQADRRSAAERIIVSHRHMSDRAIGKSVGLSAATVAALRRSSTAEAPQLNARVGRDGKVRPLDSTEGRRRAAEILAGQPETSLRDVAKAAGISAATVLDVRKRMERGESPIPGKPDAGRARRSTRSDDGNAVGDSASTTVEAVDVRGEASLATQDGGARLRVVSPSAVSPRCDELPPPITTVQKLTADPSLRNTECGRQMLRLLHATAVGAEMLPDMASTVPPHRVLAVAQLARLYSQIWDVFATELSQRARVIHPNGH